jgi:hypothetical protein
MNEKLPFPEYDHLEQENTIYGDEHQGRYSQLILQSEAAGSSAEYERDKHDANAEFIDRFNHGDEVDPSDDMVRGWMQAHYGTMNASEALTRARSQADEAHSRMTIANTQTRRDIDTLRTTITDLPKEDKVALSKNIHARLEAYAEEQGLEVGDLAFKTWKTQAEYDDNRGYTWAEWLARPVKTGYDGPMTLEDRQLLNFIQWNQHNFSEINADPEVQEEFEHDEHDFEDALIDGMNEGMLDSQLYKNMKDKPVIPLIGEPVDVSLLKAYGYTNAKGPEIIVGKNYAKTTYNHERMHKLGRLGDRFWNEGATQLLSDEIDGYQGREVAKSAYDANMKVMRDILQFADMGPRELSKFFADENYEGLMEEIYDRTYVDFDKIYQDVKREADKHYSKDVIKQQVFIGHHMTEAVQRVLESH